jgi:hypothetical protein
VHNNTSAGCFVCVLNVASYFEGADYKLQMLQNIRATMVEESELT